MLHSLGRRRPVHASFLREAFYVLAVSCLAVTWAEVWQEDLYTILGIGRDATTSQIKKAYRIKALATHPDKNPEMDPDKAALAFQKVTDAYSILSDPQAKRRYDLTGSTGSNGSRRGPGPSNQWQRQGWADMERNFQQYRQRKQQQQQQQRQQAQKPRVHPKIKEAQSYVIKVHNWEQLETVALNIDTDRLDRNLLIALCSALTEKIIDEKVHFPFPFAGMSDQKIWWEEIVVPTKVRLTSETKAAFATGLGLNSTSSGLPAMVFFRRGAELRAENAEVLYSVKDAATFHAWFWKRIETRVRFVNTHNHTVRLYWINLDEAVLQAELAPGDSASRTTVLSTEWAAFDSRTRWKRIRAARRLALGNWIVKSDLDTVFRIPQSACMDWDENCPAWASAGSRDRCLREEHVREKCPLSCKLCSPGSEEESGPKTKTVDEKASADDPGLSESRHPQHSTDVLESDPNCTDLHPECKPWAKRGECRANPSYMHEHCRHACQLCTPAGTQGPAEDPQIPASDSAQQSYKEEEKMPNVAGDQDVSQEPVASKEADGTGCDHPNTCADLHAECQAWAERGECRANPAYMHDHCRLSCHLCKASNSTTRKSSSCSQQPGKQSRGDCENAEPWDLEEIMAEIDEIVKRKISEQGTADLHRNPGGSLNAENNAGSSESNYFAGGERGVERPSTCSVMLENEWTLSFDNNDDQCTHQICAAEEKAEKEAD